MTLDSGDCFFSDFHGHVVRGSSIVKGGGGGGGGAGGTHTNQTPNLYCNRGLGGAAARSTRRARRMVAKRVSECSSGFRV